MPPENGEGRRMEVRLHVGDAGEQRTRYGAKEQESRYGRVSEA